VKAAASPSLASWDACGPRIKWWGGLFSPNATSLPGSYGTMIVLRYLGLRWIQVRTSEDLVILALKNTHQSLMTVHPYHGYSNPHRPPEPG
jgi:hypothetical protein